MHDRVRYPDHVHLAENRSSDPFGPFQRMFHPRPVTRFYRKIHFGTRVVSGESVARRSLSSFHRAESDGQQRPLEWIPIKGTKGTFWYQAKRLDKFQLLVRGIGFLGIHIYSQRPVDDFGQDSRVACPSHGEQKRFQQE